MINHPKSIHIVATSGSFEESLLKECPDYLQRLGFQVEYSSEILGQEAIYAHTKEKRFQNLKEALESPETDYIWCMRGGAGATGLIPLLKELPKPKKEKVLIGYSDITCLHLFLSQEWGWKPLHGPHIKEMARKTPSKECHTFMEELVLGQKKSFTLEKLSPLNERAKQEGRVQKKITGGNLSLIQSSLGTPWQIDCHDKILFLEDVSEKVYRTLERFEHMKQVGVLNNLAALILGDFGFFEGNEKEEKLYQVIFEKLGKEFSFPVFKTNQIGHGKDNFPVQIGQEASLELGEEAKLHLSYEL